MSILSSLKIKSKIAKLEKKREGLENMMDTLIPSLREEADKQLTELNENRMTIGGFPLIAVLDNEGQEVTYDGQHTKSVRISPMEYDEGNKELRRKSIDKVYSETEELEHMMMVMRLRSDDKSYGEEQFRADEKLFFEKHGTPFDYEKFINEPIIKADHDKAIEDLKEIGWFKNEQER